MFDLSLAAHPVKCLTAIVTGPMAFFMGEASAPYTHEALEKKLKELKKKLTDLKENLKKLEEKENGIAVLNNDAIQWKNDAKDMVIELENEIGSLQKGIEATCMCGCLPNCRGRRAAKRGIEREDAKVEEMNGRHKPWVKGYRLSDNNIVQTMRGSDIEKIWEDIRQRDGNKVICIHGIPGVGKTAVAEAVHNKALRDKDDIFSYVIYVKADYEINLQSLQEKIMRCLSIDLADTVNDAERATKIRDELVRRKKCLVIIDFLWKDFSLGEIGIPDEEFKAEGVFCKVILTCRSKFMYSKIPQKQYVEIKPLTEGWTCYERNSGPTFSDREGEAKNLVKKAVEGCDGLPTAIIELAHNLRGMQDQSSSEIALSLKEMLSSRARSAPLNDAKFKNLEYSYNRLNATTQQCFLDCALYPKGFPVEVGQLIDNWIWEGRLDSINTGSLEEKREQGRLVLMELKKERLLERDDSYGADEAVKMLNLLHYMAVNILCTQEPEVVINSGNDLTEFPPIDDDRGRYKRASFMCNKMGGVLKNQPNCPNLSTLLLQNNPFQRFSDKFFAGIPNLKLLDLSDTQICELPPSFCNLKLLQVLRLRCCVNLRSLPPFSKLEELIVLDLFRTPLEMLPKGIERLQKLKRLDLTNTKLTTFQAGLLGKLKNLQELLLLTNDAEAYSWRSKQFRFNSKEAYVEELSCLDGLRILQLNFFNIEELREYMKAIPRTMPRPRVPRFKFCVGGFNKDGNLGENSIAFIDEYPVDQQLPYGTSELYLSACSCSLTPLSTLEKTGIDFQNLKFLSLYDCGSLKYLFSLKMLQFLQNLERVYVNRCWSTLGIIEPAADSSTDAHTMSSCHLSKLQELVLIELPQLKSIYLSKHKLDWPAFHRFSIWDCDKLDSLPSILIEDDRRVIKVRGQSFKLDDHFEHEKAKVPKDIVPFVSMKKPESTSMPNTGQSKYFKRKATEKMRTSTMLRSDGEEPLLQSPGQVVSSPKKAPSWFDMVHRSIGLLFFYK